MKNNLDDLLDTKPGGTGALKRPRGVTLSTDLALEKSTNAQVHKSINAQRRDPRPSKGYKIRTDIAEAYKILAAQHGRKLYIEMEEALLTHLKRYGKDLPLLP
jgi:hypothetical protein